MGWFDSLLYPIKWAVAWIMVSVHDALVWVGLEAGSGPAWVLSIVGLTIVIRTLIIPLFFKQIKAQRGLQLVQPEMQKLQKKYKGKTDPASRQKMQQEMMALYRKHGTNPFASCLPMLLQMPIFFALFRVLYSLEPLANGTYSEGERDSIGPLTAQYAEEAQSSTLFGAPISETFLTTDILAVRIIAAALIVLMSATMFFSQRQLTMKNMPQAALDNPMARQQRMLMYIFPVIFAVSGVYFPIGVLVYWTISNVWTMGQQFYTIRRQPAPGSEAYQARRERINKKRAKKGLPPLEEEEKKAEKEAPPKPTGQRVQPKRKDRAKKSGQPKPKSPGVDAEGANGTGAAESPESSGSDADDADDASAAEHPDAGAGKGMTAAERAEKRYQQRAAQRRAKKKRK